MGLQTGDDVAGKVQRRAGATVLHPRGLFAQDRSKPAQDATTTFFLARTGEPDPVTAIRPTSWSFYKAEESEFIIYPEVGHIDFAHGNIGRCS
jgi:hypothetical protein